MINFNRTPFVLGSYRNIATFQHSERSNFPSFKIGISGEIMEESQLRFPGLALTAHDHGEIPRQVESYCLVTEFSEQSGQPQPSSTSIQLGNYMIDIDWSVDQIGKIISLSNGDYSIKFGGNRPDKWDILSGSMYSTFPSWPSNIDEIVSESFPDDIPSAFGVINLRKIQSSYSSVPKVLARQVTYPIAPIRSVPQRTYDPVQSLPEPSGSHVPMLLSKVSRENTEEWATLRKKFNAFGRRSGLYEGISVRQLGESPSDPFQIELKIGDDTINLLDVGYGVSQILPIIVDSVMQDRPRRFLLQQPEVHLHPRGHAALATFLVDRIQDTSQDFVIETHSDQLINQLRIEIRNRKLDPRAVSLLYFEKCTSGVQIHEIEIDETGNLTNAPSSYREFFLRHQYELLGLEEE